MQKYNLQNSHDMLHLIHGRKRVNAKEIYREIKKLKQELHNIFKKIPKEKESKKLWKSLVCRQNQLLLFLDDKSIPATNNA